MYKSETAKEEPSLPADTVFSGAIIDLKQGKIKDFVKEENLAKWDDPEKTTIEIQMEIVHEGTSISWKQLFPYYEKDGHVSYTSKSNFGKFKAKYNSLPEVGVSIKAMASKEGFLKILL